MISAIYSGEGYWNPIVLLVALVLVMLVVYLIRSLGNASYRKGAHTKPFLSGNVKEPEGEVRSSDMYWGFMNAYKSLYGPLMRFHAGIVNDYVGAFVAVLALFIIIILLV